MFRWIDAWHGNYEHRFWKDEAFADIKYSLEMVTQVRGGCKDPSAWEGTFSRTHAFHSHRGGGLLQATRCLWWQVLRALDRAERKLGFLHNDMRIANIMEVTIARSSLPNRLISSEQAGLKNTLAHALLACLWGDEMWHKGIVGELKCASRWSMQHRPESESTYIPKGFYSKKAPIKVKLDGAIEQPALRCNACMRMHWVFEHISMLFGPDPHAVDWSMAQATKRRDPWCSRSLTTGTRDWSAPTRRRSCPRRR